MRLRDLDAFLLRYDGGHDGADRALRLPADSSVAEADGVLFMCPLCRSHCVRVWFAERAIPAHLQPTPRWTANGLTLDDLTLTPSINLDTESARRHGSCLWHGWVRSGDAS